MTAVEFTEILLLLIRDSHLLQGGSKSWKQKDNRNTGVLNSK
jgi:hypothetical protein